MHNLTIKEPQAQTSFKDVKFIVPYKQNVHFTGRESLLDEIRTKLHERVSKKWNHQVALYGLGGIGKTQLALEYVHRNREHYERVYWISAASQATMFSGFEVIAKQTRCLRDETNTSPSEVAKGVLRWLDEQRNWLIVLDNLDDILVLDGYLPNTATHKHTLVTTRNPNSEHIPAEGILVGVYDADDAIDLLSTRTGIENISEAERQECLEIVSELGFLPLAIEQAAAYIREETKDLFMFLPIYRKNRAKFHSQKSTANRSYYEESLATTWRIAFQHIEEGSVEASRLLRLLAFLNPDGILLSFLEVGMNGLKAELRSVITDIGTLYKSLAELERFSLIRRERDEELGQIILIHRLVQAIIKDEMEPDLFAEMEVEILGLCRTAYPKWHDWEPNALQQTRIIQAQVILPLLSLRRIKSIHLVNILLEVGTSLLQDGKDQQACGLVEMAMRVVNEVGNIDEAYKLEVVGVLAAVYTSFGDLKRAVVLLEKQVEGFARLSGKHAPQTLVAMTRLSYLYAEQGDLQAAMKLQEEVLDVGKVTVSPGKEHSDTVEAMHELAVTCYSLQELERGCELGKKALNAKISLYGKNHPETLSTLALLACIYRSQGELVQSKNLQEEVLDACTTLFGKSHPRYLEAILSLGDTIRQQGDLDGAVKLHKEALEISMRINVKEHIQTFIALQSLAISYQEAGRLEESINLLEEAQATMKKHRGEDHRHTLSATVFLAIGYEQIGRLHDAIKLVEIVVDGSKRRFGKHHPTTTEHMNWLTYLYEKADDGMDQGGGH
jgi:tetratricopeptide (TPR) repeat protein